MNTNKLAKYEYHYVNNPPGYNESVFDICDAVDDFEKVLRDPKTDAYDLGAAARGSFRTTVI